MKALLSTFFLFFFLQSHSQTFNGKMLVWDYGTTMDKRIQVRMGSAGYSFGSEGTTVQVKNIGSKKLYIEFSQTFTDFCGNEKKRKFKVDVKPNEVVGGSTFLGGWEQYDYTTDCKERKKYADNFGSALRQARLELVSIREEGEPVGNTGTTNGNSSTVVSGNNSQPVGSQQQPCPPCPCAETQGSSDCPMVNFSYAEVGVNCVSLRYFEQKTITVVNKTTGEIRTDNTPTNYIVQFRKVGDLNWIERNAPSALNYNLTGLEPCTQYEVRMLRNCGGGKKSTPSTALRFTTPCPDMPSLQIQTITANSAVVNFRLSNVLGGGSSCIPVNYNRIIIEYKSDGGLWETMYYTSGKGTPPTINALRPNTGYRVRAKRDFENGKYSGYCNEVYFKTKAQ